MTKYIWIGGLLAAVALSPIGITNTQAQSNNIVPVPLVQFQDGDTAEIRSVLAAKDGWWSSFRIAFGDDFFEPSAWWLNNELLPKRFRMKDQFFGREITVSPLDEGILDEHPSDNSRGLGGFLCNEVFFAAGPLIVRRPLGEVHGRPFDIFARLDGVIRSLLFDTIGTFGFDMLATTEAGSLYRLDKAGKATKSANVNEDLKAVDLVPLDPEYGRFVGQMIVVTRFLGKVRTIDNAGVVSEIDAGREFPGAEALFILPKSAWSDQTAETGSYLLHWALQPKDPYTEQPLLTNAYALLIVRRRERREVWALQRAGTRFVAKPLFNFSNKVDEIAFLTPALLPAGGVCPAAPHWQAMR
jgi:hypothetical protein